MAAVAKTKKLLLIQMLNGDGLGGPWALDDDLLLGIGLVVADTLVDSAGRD